MFSPRYQRTSNIDAFMARRVTFFERPKKVTKEIRPDAATTPALLAVSGGRSKTHPCANDRRARSLARPCGPFPETAAMLDAARGGASIPQSDFAVSSGSGKKTAEPRSAFHPTRRDVGCNREAGCTERQKSRKTVARSGLLVSDGSSGNGRARLQSKLHPTRSGFLISGSHASGTVQVFVAWLEIHLSVGWAEPAKPNNQRVTATHQTSRNNN